ncbi:hypothetical protein [Nocardia salmonicida]|uniref:hypothetical protein n=1 Tax=Nocardia salmonicida TaxID=53431 RepID=UPI000A7EFE52|nr:hypothetical protein [Nocardia salmonicida]
MARCAAFRLGTTIQSLAIIGGALISVSSCADQETAVAQPRFDHVPASCTVALTPARTDIDLFSDGLRPEGDRISTDPDPDFDERSVGVRCASIFTRFDAWVPFDETSLRPTSRHLFVSFAVVLADSIVTDPVRHTRRLFDRRRPPNGIDVTGIGDSAYAVTTSSRYPGGTSGTIAAAVEIHFRTSNLIVSVDAGGINVHDTSDPAQLPADLSADANAIATSLAANIDTVMT